MVAKVLMNMGATVRAWAMMYKSVVETVLIYGSDIWVLMDAIPKVLEGFHHRVA